jgi:A/G-specific adenine glycosylase
MLQQTQVATVIDYFNRFLSRFPSIEALAKADEQEVLHAWQGLGYYRRARHLHAAARTVVDELGGQFPTSADELRKLPGIGAYSAGAIASIAFSRQAAILDGNVARVLARLQAIEASIDDAATKKQLWSLAETLVPESAPGDFNQSLMELGATVCLPVEPKCEACPVQSHCLAREYNLAEQLPVRTARQKQRPVTHDAFIIARAGKLLVEQRPSAGLWSNMWQLPTLEHGHTAAEGKQNPAALRQWLNQHFGIVGKLSKIDSFTHLTTHLRITFRIWHVSQHKGKLKPRSGEWTGHDSLKNLPMYKPARRIAELATELSTAQRG